MNERIVAQIQERLANICRAQNVKVPLAIESGSRAWGFPSPDSDYDCRFIFVRPTSAYLSLWRERDVIETPPDSTFDINGWDLSKALKLLLKGNAVVIEWLTSPITYSADVAFRNEFVELAREVVDRLLVGRHYLHLGERQRRTYFRDDKSVPLKKLFYALRPAAALRWLRLHPNDAVAPMHFPTLLTDCDPPADVLKVVQDLISRKAVTRELGSETLPESVRQFIDTEFQLARETFEINARPVSPDSRKRCDEFFSRTLRRMERRE